MRTSNRLPDKSDEPAGSIARPYDVERARALGALVKALKSDDRRIRAAAALAIARVAREKDGVSAKLRALVGDKKKQVRRAATLALGMVPEKSAREWTVAKILRGDSDERTLGLAVLGLGFTGENVPRLIKIAERSNDSEILTAAMLGLKAAGDPRAIPVLMRVAANTNAEREVRALAVSALASIDRRGTSVELLSRLAHTGKKRELVVAALLALGNIGGDGAERALRSLAKGEGSKKRTQGFLYLALGMAKVVDMRPWLERKLSEDDDRLGFVALGLGLMGQRSASAALVAAEAKLAEGTQLERGAIAIALGMLRANELAGLLPKWKGKAGSSESMVMIAESIALLGEEDDGRLALLKEMFDKYRGDYEIRRAAVVSASVIGFTEQAHAWITAEMGAKTKGRRRFATRLMGELPDAVLATRPLADQLWKGEDEMTRMQAAIALGQLLDRDRWDRTASRIGSLARLQQHLPFMALRRSDVLEEFYTTP